MNCPGVWEECACIAARRAQYFAGIKIAWDPALQSARVWNVECNLSQGSAAVFFLPEVLQ